MMKHILALTLLILGCTINSFSQLINWPESFEGSFPPPGWTLINGGDANTWIKYAGMPHTGTYHAGIVYNATTAHNDFLISPRLAPVAGNSNFSFWARNFSAVYPDLFDVKLSTSGTQLSDFSITIAANINAPETYTKYEYDLSAYNGQKIYIAIVAKTVNGWSLFIDDVNGCLEWKAPDPASNPVPVHLATGIVPGTTLSWTPPATGYAYTAFKICLGTTSAANEIVNGVNVGMVTTYTPALPLNLNTTYYWKVVPINAAGDAVSVPVWSFSTVEGVGNLSGTITSCHGVPVSGAGVYVSGPVSSNMATVLDGKYLFTGLPMGTYTLTAQKPGYNTYIKTGLVINLNMTTTQNFILTQPEMTVTPLVNIVTLNPGEFLNKPFTVTNPGCGPLTWTASIGNWSSTNHNWLSLPTSTGTVPYSSNVTVPALFNASNLLSGTTLSAMVTFTSVPEVGTFSIPVSLVVSGQVLVPVNTLNAILTNPLTGSVFLNWTCSPGAGFQFYSIKRNGVQIATTTLKTYNDILPDLGTYTYEVAAVYNEGATAPISAIVEWLNPIMTWTPATLSATVWTGKSKITPLSIGNSGNGTLTYTTTSHAFITSTAPVNGSIPPEGIQVVNTTFSATGAYSAVGVYTNTNVVTVTSIDPSHLSVTIPGTMTVTEPGTISGIVTEGITGNVLQGVVVSAGSNSALTNDLGVYTFQVDPGTYSIVFEKTGYQIITVSGAVVMAGSTATVNAEMYEALYPPGCLQAVVDPEDTQCVVTWCPPAGAYELLYDDGTAENFASWQLAGNMNAVKFTPKGYPTKVIGGKFYVGTGAFPVGGNFIGQQFAALVYKADGTGGMPGTKLDSVAVTVNSFGWIDVFGLNADITSGDFYLVMMQLSAEPNCVPIGVDETLPKYYRSYSRNVSANGSWVVSPFQDFMMHAIVSGPMTDDDDQLNSGIILVPEKVTGMISQSQPQANAGSEIKTAIVAAPEGYDNTDIAHHYSISRISLGPVTPVPPAAGLYTLLQSNITTTSYVESGTLWQNLPAGWYAYCVKAIYPNGQNSVCAYTGNVPHKLFADVTVKVKLTCGMVPAEGAIVKLTGFDYPYSVLTATVPASGTVLFDNIIKGRYELKISKSGYSDYITPVVINGNLLIDTPVLEDIRYKPRNLQVDSRTLTARWDQPTRAALEEDFEGTTFPPPGWTRSSSGIGWFGTTNANSPYFVVPEHTRYAVANDDVNTTNNGCCDLLITPAMDFTHEPTMVLGFQSFFTGAFGHKASVKVSTDGGATWTTVLALTGEQGWKPITVNLAAFAGPSGSANVKIAFHSDDNGMWANGWAIDDVVISPSGVTVVNPVNGYAVFLDGALVGQTTEQKFTFNPGSIMFGQTYEAGVAGQYCSGFSEKATHTFRSSFLYPPKHLTAVANTSSTSGSAILNWEAPSGGDKAANASSTNTTDGLPANLLSYKLYRNREFLATIPKTDLEYWDNYLVPDEYCYDISAVYDLSPYGPAYTGQTGESYWEGTPCVNIQFGFDLPFLEDFASGQFDVNKWTAGTNWVIDGQSGNPAPSAKFKWDPAMVDYSSSLESYYLVAANNTTTTPFKIWLDYTIKLNDRAASKKEMMSIEVWTGAGWSKVKEYTNAGDFGWKNEHINITSLAKNKVVKVRFRANGKNSGDINSWNVDSVHVYMQFQFNPPRNLNAFWYGLSSKDIKLVWNTPAGFVPGKWFHYDDGINFDGVGNGGVADFDVAIRYEPGQLSEYDGYAVKKIKFFPNEPDCEYSLRVWSGVNASTLLVDQIVASPSIKAWNEILLDAPALIDASKELWIGYRCIANTGYPAGIDEALSTDGKSNMIKWNGIWQPLTAIAPSITNDWNIQAFIDGVGDAPVTLIQPSVPDIRTKNKGTLTIDPSNNSNPSNLALRTTSDSTYDTPEGINGYDVYRRAYNKFPPGQNTTGAGDWVKINPALVTALEYFDLNLTNIPNNCFEYHVIARYNEGNSIMSNIDWECFITSLNEDAVNGVKVYPNPATDYVRIDFSKPFNGNLAIYNSTGTEVTSFNLAGENTLTLKTAEYVAGIYSLKFNSKSGESFSSKFVVIK